VAAHLPVLPLQALFIKDLTFIEDGNDTFVDEDKKRVNFRKMALIGKVVRSIRKCQQTRYDFQLEPLLDMWFRHLSTGDLNQKELYELSKVVEPPQQHHHQHRRSTLLLVLLVLCECVSTNVPVPPM
jgi:RasGEF domain